MADFSFNIAKGKVREYHDRVANNDPTNAALVLVAVVTTEADGTLQDLDDLSLVLANANTAEATNTGYSRIVLTDADITVSAPDDTNNRVDLDFADQTFSSISAGDNWTDLILCYDSDTTGGTDANIIPLIQFDFSVTPNGGDITAQLNAAGYYRVS